MDQIELTEVEDARARILAAASSLIETGGREALTTRAVATAASVQAPTIYRLFGDKRGLLDAVAEYGVAKYIGQKLLREPDPDPVKDLRDSWDVHVAFGLQHPDLFALMNGEPNASSPAVVAGLDVLRGRIKRAALAGRLRVSEERAVLLMQAICNGTVLTLLALPPDQRDAGLADAAREAVISAITTEQSDSTNGAEIAAITLRAALPEVSTLSGNECNLMGDWLERIASSKREAL